MVYARMVVLQDPAPRLPARRERGMKISRSIANWGERWQDNTAPAHRHSLQSRAQEEG